MIIEYLLIAHLTINRIYSVFLEIISIMTFSIALYQDSLSEVDDTAVLDKSLLITICSD